MNSILRALLASTVFVAAAVLVMVSLMGWHPSNFGFMHVRVVNDTKRTVKVQPCWDMACFDVIGMRQAVLRPGESRRMTGKWANNSPQAIVVGILRPNDEDMHLTGCLVEQFGPGLKEAVFHVSRKTVCPTAD